VWKFTKLQTPPRPTEGNKEETEGNKEEVTVTGSDADVEPDDELSA
jgi:hypothetical protein